MDDIILKLLEFVATAVIILISRYAIPYIKMSINDKQLQLIQSIAMDAVMWAEQTMTGGKTKKEAVLAYLQNVGIKVPEKYIDAIIESAVYQMKQEQMYVSTD